MLSWKDKLNGDPVPWLLENDETQPGVRYYALRDILGRDENDKEVKAAKAAIMVSGPVPVILAAQQPEGYWEKPGPRYSGTMPALIRMAQFGADGDDARVRAGCEYLLSQFIDSNGGISINGMPSGFNHCTAGMTGAALTDLGWLDDQRLQTAMEWLARIITGEGVADASDRDTSKGYHESSNSAPPFACAHHNADLPCEWRS